MKHADKRLNFKKIGKVLRLARALRPMRLLKRNQSMRAVIDALFATLVPVGYVLLFLLWKTSF